MYTKDKKTRVTLRLTEKQFAFVKANSDLLGVSPSDFLRIVINSAMATVKLPKTVDLSKEGIGRENDETNSDNIVQ